MTLSARFDALDEFLCAHQGLWREQPFKIARPGWTDTHPALAAELLALDDDAVAALASDNAALIDWMARHVSAFHSLPQWLAVPASPAAPRGAAAFLDWEVPGRKWRQIEHFSHAVGPMVAPVTEWCAGKGHLGRAVGARAKVAVDSLEIDGRLCEAGDALSKRARVPQRFLKRDVLRDDVRAQLRGRHVLSLHACGELHRALVRGARENAVAALDVAPCCYYRGELAGGAGLAGRGDLRLSGDDLRLAVTETVTARAREVADRDRAHAWRLGYLALRAELTGAPDYRGIKPIKTAWLRGGFEGFCRTLAARENLALPADIDWSRFEARGQQRHREVVRLSLPRFAVRRALELWLACDLALCLEGQGFVAGVEEFCSRADTPRNLRVFARQ